ncbi:MAG TPA: cyclodeaminase [Kiloniellales bacterium]|nr:cyclodeaminase [Kiloniellales bacterium]
MTITILTEKELRSCVEIDREAMEAVAEGFRGLGRGEAVMPPILRLDVKEANGEMDVKTAYVPGLDSFALKVSTGFFDNYKLGLPSLSGMMTLLSAKSGQVEAVLLDNGYLTDVRTALAGAIAADALARPDAAVAGIMGTGLQARLQLQALTLVRPIQRALIWGRDLTKAEACALEMTEKLGIPVQAVASGEALCAEADIVVTTTPARSPILEGKWLRAGMHITAMGADADEKNEVAPNALERADRLIVDRTSQCASLGELRSALAAGVVREDQAVELGEILVGKAEGRRSSAEITLCDLTGTGVQDTAIALFAHRRALERGFGTTIKT